MPQKRRKALTRSKDLPEGYQCTSCGAKKLERGKYLPNLMSPDSHKVTCTSCLREAYGWLTGDTKHLGNILRKNDPEQISLILMLVAHLDTLVWNPHAKRMIMGCRRKHSDRFLGNVQRFSIWWTHAKMAKELAKIESDISQLCDMHREFAKAILNVSP